MWHNINLKRSFWQRHFFAPKLLSLWYHYDYEKPYFSECGVRGGKGWGWWWLDMINWHGMTPGAVIARQGTLLSRGHCPWCCDIIWHVRGTLHTVHTPDTGWLKWSSSVHHSIQFICLTHINCQLNCQNLNSKSLFSCRGPVIFMTHTQNLILSNQLYSLIKQRTLACVMMAALTSYYTWSTSGSAPSSIVIITPGHILS